MYLLYFCFKFTKNKERIKKFNETGYLRYIYQNKLDKTFENINSGIQFNNKQNI